jgi:hypothetical protein
MSILVCIPSAALAWKDEKYSVKVYTWKNNTITNQKFIVDTLFLRTMYESVNDKVTKKIVEIIL